MPALAASVQTACPQNTPRAVNSPPRRPPPRTPLIVTAVSGPGVTITSTDTPANAANEPIIEPI